MLKMFKSLSKFQNNLNLYHKEALLCFFGFFLGSYLIKVKKNTLKSLFKMI